MRRLLIVACAAAALAAPTSASAAAGCGTAVLKDWADGKVDRAYPVKCYQDALDAMPEDMRSYTSAPDDIKRALLARLRATRTHHGELRGRPRLATTPPRTTAREALSAAGVTRSGGSMVRLRTSRIAATDRSSAATVAAASYRPLGR